PTAAKVTPIITGSLMPNQRVAPKDWMMDTTPQTKRSAEIRKATCSGVSWRARPTMSGTATAPAYMTSTCWKPRVRSLPDGRISLTGCTGGLPDFAMLADIRDTSVGLVLVV